jgi:hypothetical protein
VQLALSGRIVVTGVEPWSCELVDAVDEPAVVEVPPDPAGLADPVDPQAAAEPSTASTTNKAPDRRGRCEDPAIRLVVRFMATTTC